MLPCIGRPPAEAICGSCVQQLSGEFELKLPLQLRPTSSFGTCSGYTSGSTSNSGSGWGWPGLCYLLNVD